ncbi:hypothetical protein [Pseudolysinimonas sp.]|uniref:hypothetical protein n=1 Tax=Pseudolysinimonas sp. TaxID=2680009 RepID=UPI00286D0211|nr:hypothetical protein [Pseudolysinimonas sp.]
MARRIAGVAVVGLALPLAACATGEASGVGLTRAGCPADIRIQTDDMPRVEWGFLYELLDLDELRAGATSVRAPLLIDGVPSGSTLTILLGDPDDGVSANVDLYDDERILLGAVDTDVAILDADRHPTVGVFAPLLRDPRIAYWDARVHPGVPTVQFAGTLLTPDGTALIPFVTTPGDPFADYAVGARVLTVEQVVTDPPPSVEGLLDAGGIPAQTGDLLTDPYVFELLTESPDAFGSQLLDDAGYERDAGVLSARPEAVVRYADCLKVLVPVLQQALVDYLSDPDETTELIVELSARLGDDSYDADLATAALEVLEGERIAGNGRNDTIGDIDVGRLRDLIEEAIPAWKRAGLFVPDVSTDDIVTNRFIDRSIGL